VAIKCVNGHDATPHAQVSYVLCEKKFLSGIGIGSCIRVVWEVLVLLGTIDRRQFVQTIAQ
jgi:hypothetical protein